MVRPVDTEQGQRKLWVPLGVSGQVPRPGFLVLHARASTPTQMERLSGFSSLARQQGFMVAYPDALDGGWNDGRSDAFPLPGKQDDVVFLERCFQLLVSEYSVDPKKLYLVGFDSGGSLALVAGTRLGPKLAGVAACMGGFPRSQEGLLTRPCLTPMLLIQSRNDACLPFQGGAERYFGGRSRGEVLASDRLMQAWSGLGQPQASQPVAGGQLEGWSHCQRIVLNDSGHIWPGTEAPVSEELFGPLNREFSATQAIWSYFRGPQP